MSQNIDDEYSSDEVRVYKDEGDTEEIQVSGENFGIDKETLIKEAEQPPAKPLEAQVKTPKETPLNERSTPGTNRQLNNISGSLFDGNGSLSPALTNHYSALLRAGGLASALSPATLGLLAAANSQPSSSPALSADPMSALMAGVASPPAAQLAAAVAARSSPAIAALQIAAALQPYSNNRNSAGSTTPATSATPGMSSSGEQFGAMVAAAGLQQLAAAAVAQSPPVWPSASNTNSSAASNWLYGSSGPSALAAHPVTGSITSPALAASPLLARLSPAISTLLNVASSANQSAVPSPSSATSSVLSSSTVPPTVPTSNADSATATLATEVIMLRAAMAQQQQQHHHQTQQLLDAAQHIISNQQSTPTNAAATPITPRSKHMAMPTPTSRPRINQPQGADPNLTPLASVGGSIAGVKRPHPVLSHQAPRPDQNSMMQHSGAFHPLTQHQPNSTYSSAFASLDPHRAAHMMKQEHMVMPGQPPINMTGHNHGHSSPPQSNEPHIKKPLNAFMLFMKEQRAQVIAECTLKESAAINQILGQRWHNLSREEQARYYDLAKAEKEKHAQLYPNWSARENYASQAKRKKKRKMVSSVYPQGMMHGHPGIPGATGSGIGPDGMLKDPRDAALKKCRARYGIDQMDKWCKPCRRKKKCARYYNLPGADDDNETLGNDAKSTPSSHHSLAPVMMPPGMNKILPPGHGFVSGQQFAAGGPHSMMRGSAGPPDDWSDSGSSVGESLGGDDDEDEEQLNAFHLVTESSSASSTPSPSPAVLAPLSPTSSIHSSASHTLQQQQQQNMMPSTYLPQQLKLPPSSSDAAAIMFQSNGIPSMDHAVAVPAQFLNPGPHGQAAIPSSSSAASSEAPQGSQLSTTPPPSSNSATAATQLCSPNTSSTGLTAFRPLLPAN